MCRFHLPSVIGVPLMVGCLAWLGTAPAQAADRVTSSVDFVDREALTATSRVGSAGNPLRSGTTASLRGDTGNSLRVADSTGDETTAAASEPDDNVVPASYNGRQERGLQLRPKTPTTGIFSGMLGENSQSKSHAARTTPKSASAAAAFPQRPKGLVPQFMSSAAKLPGLKKPSTMRASAPQQAAYQTATSAQSYRHAATPGGATSTARRPSPPSAANSRLNTTTSGSGDGQVSTAAAALAQAHEAAATARTDEEFSAILAACQRIRADQATADEAAFGRQLAAWALNRRGQVRAGAGRPDDALADFDTAIRLDARCWRAFHNRGVLLAQSDQLEQAFDDFQQTIELSPRYAKAYSNRAALYVLAGELESALGDYQRAVKCDPKLAIAQRGCGRTCHMLGRMNEALEHMDAAIELAPDDASALASRGDLLTDLGHYADAAADYDRALDANAKSAEACRNSAWLLATCPDDAVRDPELALRRAQLAARLEQKSDAVTYDTLAAAQAAAGDFRQAVASIRQAIELSPPSERGVYQDRLQLYRRSRPYLISPLGPVRQARYER